MSVRKASILLIAGLIYTIFHKLFEALFPKLVQKGFIHSIMSVLWILATATVILFVIYFLKEGEVIVFKMKLSLYLVIIFTGLIIISRLPFIQPANSSPALRIIFRSLVIFNAFSVLLFLISLSSNLSAKELKQPVKLMLWGFVVGILLGIISFIGYLNFIISNTQPGLLVKFRIPAALVLAYIYLATIHFLVKYARFKK